MFQSVRVGFGLQCISNVLKRAFLPPLLLSSLFLPPSLLSPLLRPFSQARDVLHIFRMTVTTMIVVIVTVSFAYWGQPTGRLGASESGQQTIVEIHKYQSHEYRTAKHLRRARHGWSRTVNSYFFIWEKGSAFGDCLGRRTGRLGAECR